MSEAPTLTPGALADVKVLDLTWVLSGPYAAMVLTDLGAEVIKVERPPYGDVARTTGPHVNGESSYFFSVNRGKKSTLIDLRKPEGKDLFLRLVEKVDVVMENFTPGTMDRLGLGYAACSARNPRIIYAATSGFGQTGPDRSKPALDVVVQGMGGVMSITGEEGGGPVRPGLSLGDVAAGLFTAIGILAALHERERSGRGQMVDISMLDCQIAILENAFARYSATGVPPKAIGTRHPLSTPFQAFPTADGYIVIALGFGLAEIWGLFCALIDHPELIDDPRFDTPAHRTANHATLEPILNAGPRHGAPPPNGSKSSKPSTSPAAPCTASPKPPSTPRSKPATCSAPSKAPAATSSPSPTRPCASRARPARSVADRPSSAPTPAASCTTSSAWTKPRSTPSSPKAPPSKAKTCPRSSPRVEQPGTLR